MYCVQTKITEHVKKHENVTHNQKKNQLKTDPKMTQILHLTDKGFKAASTNMFKDLKEKIIIMNVQMGKSNRNRIYVKTTTITNGKNKSKFRT